MRKFTLISILCLLVTAFVPRAEAYTVGSLLSEWGINPGTWDSTSGTNNSDWTPDVGGVYSFVEDQTGDWSAHLGPGYGGQRYDAEAMYLAFEGDYLYMAIVTGFPSTGYYGHIPGDIAVDLGNNGTYDLGIVTSGTNTGKAYKDVTWTDCTHYDADPCNVDTANSNYAGTTNLSYYYVSDAHSAYDWYHYAIETRIPLDLWSQFPSLTDPWGYFKVHWTMTCGNDELNLVVTPEPGSLLLLLTGVFGLGMLGKKRIKAGAI